MFNQVDRFIQQHHMLQRGDRVVVGVSGGADSVCLLKVLMELRQTYQLDLFVVHVNHGLRGEEAKRDERYVESFCRSANIPCTTVEEDVECYSKTHHCSLEEAGRILRYQAFEHEYKVKSCNKIAIAHNKNDLAETILFHLVRGTGLKGLVGIPPVRGCYIRPLLAVTRAEIEAYLKEEGIPYCTDSTNLETDFTRNKVRLQILPLLNEVNNQAISHIVGTSSQISEVEEYLEKQTELLYNRIVTCENGLYSVDIELIKCNEPVLIKRVLRRMIKEAAGQLKNIEEIHVLSVYELLDKGVGKQVDLPYQILAKCSYDNLVIGKKERITATSKPDLLQSLPVEVRVPGVYFVPELGKKFSFELLDYEKNRSIPKKSCTKWFDYDKINNTIFLRTRQTGDFMQINQEGGTKPLKDVFINDKIPKEQRNSIPLLCDGAHVMWITESRISEAYKLSCKSKRILVVNISEV